MCNINAKFISDLQIVDLSDLQGCEDTLFKKVTFLDGLKNHRKTFVILA